MGAPWTSGPLQKACPSVAALIWALRPPGALYQGFKSEPQGFKGFRYVSIVVEDAQPTDLHPLQPLPRGPASNAGAKPTANVPPHMQTQNHADAASISTRHSAEGAEEDAVCVSTQKSVQRTDGDAACVSTQNSAKRTDGDAACGSTKRSPQGGASATSLLDAMMERDAERKETSKQRQADKKAQQKMAELARKAAGQTPQTPPKASSVVLPTSKVAGASTTRSPKSTETVHLPPAKTPAARPAKISCSSADVKIPYLKASINHEGSRSQYLVRTGEKGTRSKAFKYDNTLSQQQAFQDAQNYKESLISGTC